jgi:putative ubiquitin-RnfH superfamily antitoxin RatB of RatAB toxin-antitoxin module
MKSTKVQRILVQIVLSVKGDVEVVELSVPLGTSLENAVQRSMLLDKLDYEDRNDISYGVFGRKRDPKTLLCSGDRIEIYRPIIADAKALRILRAINQKDG